MCSFFALVVALIRFERVLPSIFVRLHAIYASIEGKMKSESFKAKILMCIRAWSDWTIYPNEFLVGLQNTFLGFAASNKKMRGKRNANANDNENSDEERNGGDAASDGGENGDEGEEEDEEDVDGRPLEDDEEDDDERALTGADGSSSVDGKPSML